MRRARDAPLFMSSVRIEKRSMDRDRDQIRTFFGALNRLDQSERVSDSRSIQRVISIRFRTSFNFVSSWTNSNQLQLLTNFRPNFRLQLLTNFRNNGAKFWRLQLLTNFPFLLAVRRYEGVCVCVCVCWTFFDFFDFFLPISDDVRFFKSKFFKEFFSKKCHSMFL